MSTQMESGGKDRNPRPRISPSVSRNRAPVVCPVCDNDDDDACAEISRSEDHWGPYPELVDFFCPRGHVGADLTPDQTDRILARACEWVDEGTEALREMYWDARIDSFRDDGI